MFCLLAKPLVKNIFQVCMVHSFLDAKQVKGYSKAAQNNIFTYNKTHIL